MFFKSGILLFLSLWLSYTSLDRLNISYAKIQNSRPEVLYLPNGTGLQLISFGYNSALAHILWFNAINYFGKHYRSDKDYQWLSHFCDITTSLAPESKDYYQFCGTTLSWEAGKAEQAISLYNKAIKQFPDDWLFYYLRGFTKGFFKKDGEGAKEDYILSASKPAANPIVVRLASKKIVSTSGTQEAVEFLKSAIELAEDPSSKKILEHRLMELLRADYRNRQNQK